MDQLQFPVRSCCFTGHRPEAMPFTASPDDPAFLSFLEKLERQIRFEIGMGTRHFITGMCKGMDLWAADAVLRLRREAPDITLEAAIPYPGHEKKWDESEKALYAKILAACDPCTFVRPANCRGVMMIRNRYMVDHASVCIAAMLPGTQKGGTFETVKMARKKGIEVVNIFEIG